MSFDLFSWMWAVLVLPLGWLVKQIGDLKKDYYETKVHAAETFVRKDDYRQDVHRLHEKLDSYMEKTEAHFSHVIEKLDNKADKERK